MEWLAVLLVVLAVSVDGVAVGAAYGFQRVRVPGRSLAIIGTISNLLALLAVSGGRLLSVRFSAHAAARVGAAVFFVLGVWYLLKGVAARGDPGGAGGGGAERRSLLRLHLKSLGLVIQVLQDPQTADLDRSGRLEPREAALLGFSLALDALAAGFALALTGQGLLFAAVVGPAQVLMLYAGSLLAQRAPRRGGVMSYLPGGILLMVGLLRLI